MNEKKLTWSWGEEVNQAQTLKYAIVIITRGDPPIIHSLYRKRIRIEINQAKNRNLTRLREIRRKKCRFAVIIPNVIQILL